MTAGLFQPRPPYCIARILSRALSFQIRWRDPGPEIKWIFLRIKLNEYKRIKLNYYINTSVLLGFLPLRKSIYFHM